ncbi:Probable RNA-directed DNA polymerase from transposon BS [Eumeta japonica]|uniref:Probable RNA-directed DNA polymerase from transposon BS n=1 Tax=Eumeta variegata TaxID=151549 RepID=A0A4C1VCQ5_EUMVA|nr:Probable RNA-directed DNA polymerase from transposon BS [Eumeta japonica]
MLAKEPDHQQCDFSCFQEIYMGGSAVPEELLTKYRELAPDAVVARVYGMSELSGLAFCPDPTRAETCGRKMGCFEYRVRKPRDLPASYRPISLLSGLAKLFERILKTRLSDHLLGKDLIIDEQFGFRPTHSCPQQVPRLVEYVSEGFKTKQKTVVVFFDVVKAFDREWHAGLVSKLYSLQIPDRLILIIQNYLANRYFTFRHERTHSIRRLIRAGVPQASVLCPLLYSAYTNDIPRPTSGVQLALFADDTALFFRSRDRRSIFRHLQRDL